MDVVDFNLPATLMNFLSQLFGVIVVMIIISYSTPIILAVIAPVLVIYYKILVSRNVHAKSHKRIQEAHGFPFTLTVS